jgi:NAD-dependent deacetylase
MKLFVLTGAGISAESGMGTFRDKGGIWEQFDPMELATPESICARSARGACVLQYAS